MKEDNIYSRKTNCLTQNVPIAATKTDSPILARIEDLAETVGELQHVIDKLITKTSPVSFVFSVDLAPACEQPQTSKVEEEVIRINDNARYAIHRILALIDNVRV